MRVTLDLVTMQGARYVLLDRGNGPEFPHGELKSGEAPGAAARRILLDWTGLTDPKLEVVDFVTEADELRMLFRAISADLPKVAHKTAGRMELPPKLGRLTGPAVEEALKTSLAYKLIRR